MNNPKKQLARKQKRLSFLETVLIPEAEKAAIGERLRSIAVMGLDPVPSNNLITDYKKEKIQLVNDIYRMQHELNCQGIVLISEPDNGPKSQKDHIEVFLIENYNSEFGFMCVKEMARECCKDLINKGFYGPDDYTERRIDIIRREINRLKNHR